MRDSLSKPQHSWGVGDQGSKALAFLGLAILLAAPSSAFAVGYSVRYSYQLFPNGDPAQETDTVIFQNGITSFDETFSATSDGNTNTATTRVNIADGSIRLRAATTAVRGRSGAQASGDFQDSLIFDLPDGVPFIFIPYSITVNGTVNEVSGQVGAVSAGLGGGGQAGSGGQKSLTDIFGTTYSGLGQVFDGQEASVTMSFVMNVRTLDPNAVTTVIADALSTAVFSWELPEGVTYTSASGVFAPIPIPATMWLLGSALGCLGWLKRRKA